MLEKKSCGSESADQGEAKMPPVRSAILAAALGIAGCTTPGTGPYPATGVQPTFSFPVTNNETPYSRCLESLAAIPANNTPVFAVGDVSDKTGQFSDSDNGRVLSQGVAEMVMSALFKTGKARLVERYDLRIPLAEVRMSETGMSTRETDGFRTLSYDFLVLGALTELNYNIVSEGAGLHVAGIGGGARTVVINVALDLRVIDGPTFGVRYVSSLQKQILGYEVEANVFRFFGTTLVEFDAGRIRNEPLQLGVRSVVEMAVYQIMTDFLRLPTQDESCGLVETDYMSNVLEGSIGQ